jgi:hypothetical protein
VDQPFWDQYNHSILILAKMVLIPVLGFSTMRRSDLVRVNYDGNALEGGRNRLINRAGIMIHRGCEVT